MIEIKNVTVRFGDNTVFNGFDLIVPRGSRIAVMGPSGGGKTTLLKLIAGQLRPASGSVSISADRISYMFQEPRLLPWLTAEENVNLILGDKQETLPVARLWLERVGLADSAKKRPAELSGGMRQRVALARALAYNGDLFLFDEPLSALDQDLIGDMLSLINEYTAGKTVLFVTHSREQAQIISDRIVYIKKD